MPRRCVTRRPPPGTRSPGRPGVLSQALSHVAFNRLRAGEGVQREILMRADALEREGPGRARDDGPLRDPRSSSSVGGDLAEARELLSAELDGPATGLSRPRVALSCSPSSRSAPGAGSSRSGTPDKSLELTLGAERVELRGGDPLDLLSLVDAHRGRVGVRSRRTPRRAAARRSNSATWPSRRDALPRARVRGRCRSATPRPRSATSLRSRDNEERLGILRAVDVLHRSRPRRGAGARSATWPPRATCRRGLESRGRELGRSVGRSPRRCAAAASSPPSKAWH